MPVGYDTPINEYWNTIERAGLWDVAVQRIVEISGGDARDFMDILTPRGLSKVGVGGFVLADIDVIRNRNGLEVDTPEGIRDLEITDIPFIDANKTIPRQTLR